MWACIIGVISNIAGFISSLFSCFSCKKCHVSCCEIDINNRSNENINYQEKISK